MGKIKPRKLREKVAAERAKPVRTLFQALLKDHIKTQDEKQALAEFLGQSIPAVESMLYQGSGGLDSWISAFIFCYQLDVAKIEAFLQSYRTIFRKTKNSRLSDRLWFALDEFLSEDEKASWAALIRSSIELSLHLRGGKKVGSESLNPKK